MDSLGFHQHDHSRCIHDALASAEAECAARGLQFTPVRRRALEVLVAEHRALGAYAVLEYLSADGLGSQPPVAYRALEFLVKNGFAHRIERLNAFVACSHPGENHAPAFLVCRDCNIVAESPGPAASDALQEGAAQIGFVVETMVIEALGLCPDCRTAKA